MRGVVCCTSEDTITGMDFDAFQCCMGFASVRRCMVYLSINTYPYENTF